MQKSPDRDHLETPVEMLNMNPDATNNVSGICAILGTDIVSFSTLSDEDQLTAVKFLIKWIRAALDFHEISKQEYHWSPAGDGGFLTFKTPAASEKALEVAFSILEKARNPTWVPRNGRRVELRFGVNAGVVYESEELGGGTNIWGDGINMAARVLSVTANSQVLVSDQYFNAYLRNKGQVDFVFNEPFPRTVKHGVRIYVRNCRRGDLGLQESEEIARRWAPIGTTWRHAIESYLHLIKDAVDCDDPVAALAASKFLLELNDDSRDADAKANEIFTAIGESGNVGRRRALRDPVFNVMPPSLLRKLVENAIPRSVNKGDFLYQDGDKAKSCFFLVYGALRVTGLNSRHAIQILPGQIIGEFALWIPNSRRTATIEATDHSLLLEVPNSLFADISNQSPETANQIHLVIKRRLLENVVESEDFFPGLAEPDRDRLKHQPGFVEKHAAGTRLDLTSKTYIIFHGKVRLTPPMLDGHVYDVENTGHFNRKAVVGIESETESLLDGPAGEVLEECVTVGFGHDTLLELCQKSSKLQEAWDEIWGQRHGSLMRVMSEPKSSGEKGKLRA